MSIANKLTYLNQTKQLIKESINLTGANITNEPFRDYAIMLRNRLPELIGDPSPIWFNYEHVTGSGTSFSINAYNSIFNYDIKGDTVQDGTPTPDAPIPVNVVSGDNTIDICGKNLFDDSAFSTNPNVSVDSNGFYTGTLANIYSYFNNNFKNYAYKENTQYTITYTSYGSNTSSNGRFTVYYTDGTTQNWNITSNASATDIIYRSTSGKTISKITMIYGSSGTMYIKNIMLVEGIYDLQTMPSYEPYIGNTYPIYLGVENLFDKDNVVSVNGKILNDSGTEISDSGGGYTKMYMPVQPNTQYSISGLGSSGTKRIYYFDNTKTFISRTSGFSGTSTTITTPSNCYYLDIQYATSGNDFATYQVSKGTNHISSTPIELCKIRDYQDYIYKEGKKWYLHKEIGKVVLDGSETWSYETVDGYDAFKYNVTDMFETNTGIGLSNYYQNITPTGDGRMRLGWGNTLMYFFNNTSRFNGSIDNFKVWLSTHNLIVYYRLATPTETEITDANLILQLNSVRLVNGVNNIITVGSDLNPILNIEAIKHLD